ncbi:MAG TPA: HlyD family efflux transporter periplasmic adaptor subunit, partial [Caldimonas sp.]|nr:HlyD family efflux transporter periplasmic adaptor subunit [Caldimonas sp.]
RPVSLRALTLVVSVAAVAVAVFLVVGEYTRKARVSGYLVPDRGVIRLAAPQSATIVESRAREGATVHKGDVLFVLGVGQATTSGDTQEAIRSTLVARERSLQGAARRQADLEQARVSAIDRQLEAMQHELASMAGETALQAERLRLAQQSLEELEALHRQNFVSSAQIQRKSEEVLGIKAQIQAVERQRAAHAREMAALQAQRREIPLQAQAAQGEIDRDLAALAQQTAENAARGRIVVQAPQDGVLTGVLAEAGQSIPAAAALATLVPSDTHLEAQLFAPSSAIGFVRPDQPVLLRYDAFPYQKFGHQSGRVVRVSPSPLPSSELAALPFLHGTAQEPLYRITVALERQAVPAYGKAQPLAPGMQLEADVLLDRRRLIEWIFEPVLGMAGRV